MASELSFNCLEKRDDGSWVCIRSAKIAGKFGTVPVHDGQKFGPGTMYAGYDDFAAYLECIADIEIKIIDVKK